MKLGGQYLDTRRLSNYRVNYFGNQDASQNDWSYRERIIGSYLGTSKKINSKSFLALSLRLENTTVQGILSTTNEKINKNYCNLFPYFYFSHTINDQLSYHLLYTISIYRPPIYLLNNYANRILDNLYDVGNPNLRPELTQNSEISMQYKKHTLSLFYDYSPNAITEVFTIKNNIIYHSNINDGSKSTWGLNYSFTGKLTSWWELNSSLLLAYDRIPNSYNKTHLLYNESSLSNRFSVGKVCVLSLDLSGSTGHISGSSYSKPNFVSDFSLSRSFSKESFSVQLGVNDLFNTNRMRGETRTPELDYICSMKNLTRSLWVSLSYSFSSKTRIHNIRVQNDNTIINRL